jgi:hypothetical protein
MKKVFSFVAVAAMTVALFSCNEATEEAVTEGEAVEAATEAVEAAVEEATEAVDAAVEEATEAVEEATETVEAATEEAM